MSDETRAPRFGERFRNAVAGESNPHRDGFYVQTIHVPKGRMNSGRWYRMTDGNGEFWDVDPTMLRRAPEEQGADRDALVAELEDRARRDGGDKLLEDAAAVLRGGADREALAAELADVTLWVYRCVWCRAYEGTVNPAERCAQGASSTYVGPHDFRIERVDPAALREQSPPAPYCSKCSDVDPVFCNGMPQVPFRVGSPCCMECACPCHLPDTAKAEAKTVVPGTAAALRSHRGAAAPRQPDAEWVDRLDTLISDLVTAALVPDADRVAIRTSALIAHILSRAPVEED